MEVLDIGKKVFAVVTEYNGHALASVSIKHVDREYRVTYEFDKAIANACNVFDTKEEALARVCEIIDQNTLQLLDGSISLTELFTKRASTVSSVLPDDKAIDMCMVMDKVIRCINDEENGIFEDWITLHVPDECSRDEWAELIEGHVQEACLEAFEFFARRMFSLIAKGALSKKGWILQLFNDGDHYLYDVVKKDKDEEDEFDL